MSGVRYTCICVLYLLTCQPLRIKIDLVTYEIEFDLFIVLDKEVYEDCLAVYRTLISHTDPQKKPVSF